MEKLTRRGFLRAGAAGAVGGIAGFSLGSRQSPSLSRGISPAYAQGNPQAYVFTIERGLIYQLDADNSQVLSATPWAVPAKFKRLIPILATPFIPSLERLMNWADKVQQSEATPLSNLGKSTDPVDVIMGARISGAPEVADIVGTSVISLVDQNELDLSLDFLFRSTFEILNPADLPVKGKRPPVQFSAPLPSLAENPSVPIPPHIDLFGWRLLIHGPETSPFGDCVREPVRHFNIEVQRALGRGRFQKVSNFHLGTYLNAGRRCFVLWNNLTPKVCLKTCTPTLNDLIQMFSFIIVASAALIGITVAAWIVAVIATVAASILFTPLLLLV